MLDLQNGSMHPSALSIVLEPNVGHLLKRTASRAGKVLVCQHVPFVLAMGTEMLNYAVQRLAMKEAAPVYKSLTAEEKAQYIKIAEGGRQPASVLWNPNR